MFLQNFAIFKKQHEITLNTFSLSLIIWKTAIEIWPSKWTRARERTGGPENWTVPPPWKLYFNPCTADYLLDVWWEANEVLDWETRPNSLSSRRRTHNFEVLRLCIAQLNAPHLLHCQSHSTYSWNNTPHTTILSSRQNSTKQIYIGKLAKHLAPSLPYTDGILVIWLNTVTMNHTSETTLIQTTISPSCPAN